MANVYVEGEGPISVADLADMLQSAHRYGIDRTMDAVRAAFTDLLIDTDVISADLVWATLDLIGANK